jgi:hypothetical protein
MISPIAMKTELKITVNYGKVMFEWKIMLSGEVGEVRINHLQLTT